MKRPSLKTIGIGIAGLAAAAVMLYLGYLALAKVIGAILALQNEVAAAIIAAAGTVLAGLLITAYTQSRSKKREIRESHRAQKIQTYKALLDLYMVGLLKAMKQKDKAFNAEEYVKEQQAKHIDMVADVIVWASPDVIRSYFALKSPSDPHAAILLVDDLLNAIRKDLGNSNFGIERGKLISLFLTDPEEIRRYIAEQEAKKKA